MLLEAGANALQADKDGKSVSIKERDLQYFRDNTEIIQYIGTGLALIVAAIIVKKFFLFKSDTTMDFLNQLKNPSGQLDEKKILDCLKTGQLDEKKMLDCLKRYHDQLLHRIDVPTPQEEVCYKEILFRIMYKFIKEENQNNGNLPNLQAILNPENSVTLNSVTLANIWEEYKDNEFLEIIIPLATDFNKYVRPRDIIYYPPLPHHTLQENANHLFPASRSSIPFKFKEFEEFYKKEVESLDNHFGKKGLSKARKK